MKQNCHFQSGVLQCKIVTKPLNSSGIHNTLALSKEVYNFAFAQGAKKLSALKV